MTGRTCRASAPGRICLAGESLDWMVAGPSVVAAIDRRIEVIAHLAEGGAELLLESGAPVDARRRVPGAGLGELAGDQLDHLQAVAFLAGQRTGRAPTGRLEVSSALPVGAGLSSSASVTAAAAAVVLAGAGAPALPAVVAGLAYAGERMTGSGAGWMDFLAVTYGGINLLEAGDPPAVRPLTGRLNASIVLIDTLTRRSTGEQLLDKRRRWAARDPDLLAYVDGTRTLVSKIADALAGSPGDPADPGDIGGLIFEAHLLLVERMRCSTPLIDACVTACLAAGAYGAKLTGSGHGGCLFALAAPERTTEIIAALRHLPVGVEVLDGPDTDGVRIALDT